MIIESRDADARPRITILDEHGEIRQLPHVDLQARYFLPVGANIFVAENDQVMAGDDHRQDPA